LPLEIIDGDQWVTDHNAFVLTAEYLVEVEGYLAKDLLGYLEKPYNYSEQYHLAVARYNETAATEAAATPAV